MVPVYAICVTVGVVALLAWVLLGLTASSVAGKANLDPEARFGQVGRDTISGLLGFGLGGMSASFGGWPAGLAAVGAVAGAVAAVLIGRYLGFEEDSAGNDN